VANESTIDELRRQVDRLLNELSIKEEKRREAMVRIRELEATVSALQHYAWQCDGSVDARRLDAMDRLLGFVSDIRFYTRNGHRAMQLNWGDKYKHTGVTQLKWDDKYEHTEVTQGGGVRTLIDKNRMWWEG
jgi:hypothetical protein